MEYTYMWLLCAIFVTSAMQNILAEASDLDSKVKELEMKISVMSEMYSSEISSLKEEIAYLQKRVRATNVAFSAYLDLGEVFPTPGSIIPFGGVMLNSGGHYDASDSVFTCPATGIYFFTFNLNSCEMRGGQTIYRAAGSLVLNDGAMSETYCRTYDPDYAIRLQSSSSVLLECPSGGRVWIEAESDRTCVHGLSYQRQSSFSGVMLSYLDP